MGELGSRQPVRGRLARWALAPVAAVALVVSVVVPQVASHAATSSPEAHPARKAVLTGAQAPPGARRPRPQLGPALLGGPPTAQFQITFDAGFQANPAAEAAFQAAVNIWASEIVSSVPIRVTARLSDLGFSGGSFPVGEGGPSDVIMHFPNQPNPNVAYPLALANALAGAEQEPTNSCNCEIETQFNGNGNVPWYFGTDGNVPGSSFDFETVVLHELGHGLGFGVSDMTVSGGQGSYSFPAIWDAFTKTTGGTPILSFPNPSAQLAAALTTDQGVVFDGPHTDAAGGPAHLFTPPQWLQGTSYAHLDQRGVLGAPSTGTDFYPDGSIEGLMRPLVFSGEAYHSPGPLTLGMFQDMGWGISAGSTGTTTTTTPGSTGGTGTLTGTAYKGAKAKATKVIPGATVLVNGAPVATTGSSGTFSVVEAPGTYNEAVTVAGRACHANTKKGPTSVPVSVSSGSVSQVVWFCKRA